jgi:flagellin-specific chaperone FliS
MAWGADGQEVREVIRTEVALARMHMHPEKGPQLTTFVDQVYEILERLEATLNR